MLGKLIKYEFRCSVRIFAILLPAFLAYTAIYRGIIELLVRSMGSSENGSAILAMIMGGMTFLFIILLAGLVAFNFIYIIYRFYKNMVTDEGYLMHTLPVSPWEHVTAKLIIAALQYIATIITIVLSVLIIIVGLLDQSVIDEIKYILDSATGSIYVDGSQLLNDVLDLLSAVISVTANILVAYASIAIGQLKNNNRALWSIGAYILVNITLSIVSSSVSILLTSSMSETTSPALIMNLSTGISTLFNLVVAAAAFVCTCKIFSKNLNLR